MSDEPAAKKIKPTGWEDHTLNCSEAVMKADEGRFFRELAAEESTTSMQGIGPKSEELLDALGVKTVKDLATYKYFLLSRAILTLAETEVKDGRPTGSCMNIDKAVDKEYETKSFKEIIEAPTSAIQGLSEKARLYLKDLHVHTIKDLASFKYCRHAEAIVEAAKYEEGKTAAERKAEKVKKMLE